MSKLWQRVILIAGVLGVAIVLAGQMWDWSASRHTVFLTLTSLVAFFVGTAALGGTGPAQNLGPSALSDGVAESVARGEETRQAYKPSGRESSDTLTRWRARGGWNPGNYSIAKVMLVIGAIYAVAALFVWQVVE